MIEAFNPPSVWSPFSAFSMGVAQGGGRIVHVKGQVALDRAGRVVGEGDMGAQTRTTLENIRLVLAAVGGQMQDIVALTHYVTDIERFMETRQVRLEFFREPFPATTTVQVVRLFRTDLLVEITATAEIPLERFRPPPKRPYVPVEAPASDSGRYIEP
jgi:enamine deaminase RidA (YjgF/YER057c/UK114 family)